LSGERWVEECESRFGRNGRRSRAPHSRARAKAEQVISDRGDQKPDALDRPEWGSEVQCAAASAGTGMRIGAVVPREAGARSG
jgi:hypothetical protein